MEKPKRKYCLMRSGSNWKNIKNHKCCVQEYLNKASIWLCSMMLCDLMGSNNQKASSSFQKILLCTVCLFQMMLVKQFKKRVKNIFMYIVYLRNTINMYNIQLSNSFKSYHKLTSCDHNEEQS